MPYDLSSGQLAEALGESGVSLSPSTIQRYARTGRIPSRVSPGGRYRYNLYEVRRSLETLTASQTLGAEVLTGGLGRGGELNTSTNDRLRTAVRGHQTEPVAASAAPSPAPTPVHEQLRHAATRVFAFASA